MSFPFESELLPPNTLIEVPPMTIQLVPVKMSILPNGTKDDKPSLAFHLATGNGGVVVIAQISVKMLYNSLSDEALHVLRDEIFLLEVENCRGKIRS